MSGETKSEQNFKYLYFVISAYITFALLAIVLIYKIIDVDGILISAATIIVSFWYATSDLLTEVYGYKISRSLIWGLIFSEILFIFISYFLIQLPSPPVLGNQQAYVDIFGQLPRVFLGSIAAIFAGSFSNIYCLAKLKIFTEGRRFWMRSMGASAIGELVFTIVCFIIEFVGKMPFSQIINLMVASYCFKLIFLGVATIPTAFLADVLKKSEGIDVYDYTTNFNPFIFRSD